ncbi:MAG: hypothetical protein KKE05_01775, partial [Nanoarchaeota archaeon]|nr:hypothetical protein [Nanoarchaeota archaeon]
TQQLFDTNHPLAGSSTTFRNRLANNPRLSTGSLEAMQRLVVEETYNHLGEKKTISHDILWTTDDPNTKNMARRILGSPADVDGAHSGILNVNKGELKHVVLPRVATTAAGAPDSDKRYYWGLAASQLSSFYLGIWERPHMGTPPAKFNWDVWTDVQTDDCEFPNRAGYGICVVGANWVKFSSGDGSA